MSEHEAHVGRRLIDVSTLPQYAFGHRDPIWWGVWLLLAIETTMFALLVTSYLYLRGNFSIWPPPGAENAPLAITATTLGILLLSCVPNYLAFRAAREESLRGVQLGMSGVTLAGVLAAVARGFEIWMIGYGWHSHAYGSIVWSFYFMHTFHLVTGCVENAVITVLLFTGPVEKKLMPDIRLSAMYWWMVVAWWIPLWAMVVFDGRGLR